MANELQHWIAWLAALAAFAGVLAAVGAADRVVLAETPAASQISITARLLMALIGSITALAVVTPSNTIACLTLIVALAYFAAFDLRFFAVPVWPILVCAVLGLVWQNGLSADSAPVRLLAALMGLLAFVGLDWVYRALRGRSGLGFGDALIAALIGAWLSWQGVVWSVALGASLGAAFAVLNGSVRAPSPFAPSLAAGAALCLALGLSR